MLRKMLLLSILTLVSLFPNRVRSQSDFEILTYNLLFGAVTGGLGAAINKPAAVKWNKSFYDGAWKGSIGGATIFAGKKLISYVNDDNDFLIAWSSKIVHDTGASILENVANNQPMFSQLNLNIGFIRNEWHLENHFHFRSKIKPTSAGLTLYSALGNKFEFTKSLLYGTPIFTRNPDNLPNAAAITHGNSIVFRSNLFDNFDLSNHEMIHVFQYDQFAVFNSFLPALKIDLMNNNYKYFYIDYHATVFYSFYFVDELIQGRGYNFLKEKHIILEKLLAIKLMN